MTGPCWLPEGSQAWAPCSLAVKLWLAPPVDLLEPARWSLEAVRYSAPIYGLALLVLVPGGLLAVVVYRGHRRRTLMVAVALHLATYLFYPYSGEDSGRIERVAVAGRYFIPLVPLIILAWADTVSRHFRAFRGLIPAAHWALLAAAFAIHPAMQAWSSRDAAIVQDIVSTTAGGAMIVDTPQRKFVAAGYGPFTRFWMIDTPPARLAQLVMQQRETYIVRVSRSDTASMAELWATPQNYVERARGQCHLEPVRDQRYGTARRLQIWRVQACRSADSHGP